MDTILKIDRLYFTYGSDNQADSKKQIFENYSLTLNRGERICLSAPSGSGKTTLLRLIAGLEKPDSGSISVIGKLAYMFQENRLLEWLTAMENLTFIGCPRDRALELLDAVGLSDAADKLPRELSGGMKRRLAAVRTAAHGGELLLLDEPFSGLDDKSRDRTAQLLNESFTDAAMILVTHSPTDAELLGARIDDTPFAAGSENVPDTREIGSKKRDNR